MIRPLYIASAVFLFGLSACDFPVQKLKDCPPPSPGTQPGTTTAPVAQAAPAVQKLVARQPRFMETSPFEMGGACNMETINGAKWGNSIVQITDRSKIVIAGWAVDDKAKKSPVAVSLRLQHEGKAFHADAKILPRPELAAYFKESFYQNSGYEVTVSAADLPAGEYEALVVIGTGAKAIMCASGRKLVLK